MGVKLVNMTWSIFQNTNHYAIAIRFFVVVFSLSHQFFLPAFKSKNIQLVNYTRHHFHLYNLLQLHIQFYATLTVLIWGVYTQMHSF